MPTLREKARILHALHVKGRPLVLFNVWDVGSAKAVNAAGARAIATGSWSVANANGYEDGERVPLDFALDNLVRITRAVEAPVTIDLESGYGKTPDEVASTIDRAIQAGAAGCNLEDSYPDNGSLRDPAEQATRIQRARAAADKHDIPFFINARTDVFFAEAKGTDDDERVSAVLARAKVYAAAGADGLFVPGVTDRTLIARLAAGTALPVNVMVSEGTPPLRELATLGVARVSHGPGPFLAAMKQLQEAARHAALSE